MENYRLYGDGPARVAVVHGGPGAAGELAPLARALAQGRAVLEPLQTERSVEGQALELARTLTEHGAPPLALIGHSWGAWLAMLVAARWPQLVRKLILVGCAPLVEQDAAEILPARLARLSPKERATVQALRERLNASDEGATKDDVLAELGRLMAQADTFEPIVEPDPAAAVMHCDAEIFRRVWAEAAELRRSGALLAAAQGITCPVVAIHGAHDPHPAHGVQRPLSQSLKHFRSILIERCGHAPWRERHACQPFLDSLNQILAEDWPETTDQ